MLGRTPFILMAILCAALLTLGARAQHRIDPQFDAEVAPARVPTVLLDAAKAAPGDITTLIVARDLKGLRKTDASGALLSIMHQMDLFPASRGAWNGLSRQLGVPPEQAFDELLGEHVVFITRDDPNPAQGKPGATWALTSRVPLSAAKRLGGSLGATPRTNLAGLPVFSLENGGFVLHIRSEKRADTAWITIGPGDRPGLFRELLDPPAGARTLADNADFADLIAALPEAGDAFVYRRFSPDAPDFAVGSVRLVKSTMAATYAAFTGEPTQPPDEGWSRQAFDGLRERSVLTILESGPTSAGRLLETTGGLAAMGPVRGLAAIFRPFEPRSMVGERGGLVIRRSRGSSMGVAYAISTPDSAALVPAADQYMATQLAALFPKVINAEQRIDIEGYAPEAMRTVPLRGTGVAGLFRDKDNATFAWVCVPSEGGPEGRAAGEGGWWIAGIDPDTIERTAKSLSGADSIGEWSALGEIRPKDLIALFDSAAVLPIPAADADLMRRIERITVSERRLSPAKVVGSFSMEFVPAPAPPGG